MMRDQPTTGRITPYEVVFGTSGFAEREFPVIDEEAKRASAQGLRRDQFAGLESLQILYDCVYRGAFGFYDVLLRG